MVSPYKSAAKCFAKDAKTTAFQQGGSMQPGPSEDMSRDLAGLSSRSCCLFLCGIISWAYHLLHYSKNDILYYIWNRQIISHKILMEPGIFTYTFTIKINHSCRWIYRFVTWIPYEYFSPTPGNRRWRRDELRLCHRLDFYWRPRQLLLSYLRVAAQSFGHFQNFEGEVGADDGRCLECLVYHKSFGLLSFEMELARLVVVTKKL